VKRKNKDRNKATKQLRWKETNKQDQVCASLFVCLFGWAGMCVLVFIFNELLLRLLLFDV